MVCSHSALQSQKWNIYNLFSLKFTSSLLKTEHQIEATRTIIHSCINEGSRENCNTSKPLKRSSSEKIRTKASRTVNRNVRNWHRLLWRGSVGDWTNLIHRVKKPPAWASLPSNWAKCLLRQNVTCLDDGPSPLALILWPAAACWGAGSPPALVAAWGTKRLVAMHALGGARRTKRVTPRGLLLGAGKDWELAPFWSCWWEAMGRLFLAPQPGARVLGESRVIAVCAGALLHKVKRCTVLSGALASPQAFCKAMVCFRNSPARGLAPRALSHGCRFAACYGFSIPCLLSPGQVSTRALLCT